MSKKPLPYTASLDRATPNARLFKVLSKEDESNRKRLEAHTYFTNEDKSQTAVKYVAPYELDATDLRVYLAVMGLSKLSHERTSSATTDIQLKSLWNEMRMVALPREYNEAAVLRTNTHEICRAAGMKWGQDVPKRIYAALDRLGAVTAKFTNGSRSMSSNMLRYAYDEDDGKISVMISPLFATALLDNPHQHLKASLHEMRQLKKHASIILHFYLTILHSGPRGKGHKTYKLDTLCEAVYGQPRDDRQKTDRRKLIRPALDELSKLEFWQIARNDETNKVSICRSTPSDIEAWMNDADNVHRSMSKP